MLNNDAIRREIEKLERLQERLVAVIRKSPKGSVFYLDYGSEDATPYLHRQEKDKRIRRKLNAKDKEDARLIMALKDKKFARHLLPRVRKNKAALQAASAYEPISRSFLEELGAPFRECENRFFKRPETRDEFDMLQERQNPSYREHMNITSPLGVFRSKNELLIAQVLNEFRLQNKVEAPLYTLRGVRYPDFTVLHPKTGRLIYIEVCGRLDDPEYLEDLLRKLRDYAEIGVFLGVNLFIISEEPGKGLDVSAIRELIRGIFAL